jgi:uncharacterized protein YoaH (UPF0181 family)
MLNLIWTYYPPGEVARAVEHIDVLVERGLSPEEAVQDAARIYRQRTGDHRTPFVRGHLAAHGLGGQRQETSAQQIPDRGQPARLVPQAVLRVNLIRAHKRRRSG